MTISTAPLSNLLTTLSDKPHYGILSSILTVTLTATQWLQMIGVILGLFIAVITAILKIMEFSDKMKEKKKKKLEEEGKAGRKKRRKKDV